MYKKLIICSTGRSGTVSLCNLLDSNKNIFCDHELYFGLPTKSSKVSFNYSKLFLEQLIEDYSDKKVSQRRLALQVLERHKNSSFDKNNYDIIVGDSGMYYLNYLEDLYSKVENLKIIYLYRENIESFVKSFNNLIDIHKCNPLVLSDYKHKVPKRTLHLPAFPTIKEFVKSKKERDDVIIEYHNLFQIKFNYLEKIGVPFFKIKTENLSNKDELIKMYKFLGYKEDPKFNMKNLNRSENFKDISEERDSFFNQKDSSGNIIYDTNYKNKKIKRLT